MYLMILGAPGSGKGTQGNLLAEHLKVPEVSTGELLRAAVRRDGAREGSQESTWTRGNRAPDNAALGLIKEILDSKEARGVMMDGFPGPTRRRWTSPARSRPRWTGSSCSTSRRRS